MWFFSSSVFLNQLPVLSDIYDKQNDTGKYSLRVFMFPLPIFIPPVHTAPKVYDKVDICPQRFTSDSALSSQLGSKVICFRNST